jgi:DNA-cytosine methyltransferase
MQIREIRTVDLFAGIGGFHHGLTQASDAFRCVWASEWDKYASSVYRHNFPETPLDTRDIRTVPAEEVPQHDLLCGGFPCFARGTLILTKGGFISIESVHVGDIVLTHRGLWKKVTNIMRRRGKGRQVEGQGILKTTTSDEHPYYARTSRRKWISKTRNYKREFSEPEWIAAEDIKGKYACSVLPEQTELEGDEDFWWIVGRYIADGWIVNRRDRGDGGSAKVIICGGKHEADALEERIRRKFHCTKAPERTVVKFHISNREFARFLEPIGKGAGNKQIPPQWLGARREIAAAILDGYLSGDGSKNRQGSSATTVSPALALGVAMLSQNARGIKPTIAFNLVPPTKEIEGRTVNQQPFYIIQIPNRNRSAFVEGRYGWGLVRVSLPTEEEIDLFNLEVEDDNSYVANGAVVHNCQAFSVAGRREGFNDTRGTLFREIVRIAEHRRPQLLLLENVKGLLNHDSGNTFRVILEELGHIGYRCEWQVLNTKWFGVPQNRERVFIVGHLGGGSPRAVFPFTDIGETSLGELGERGEIAHAIDGNYFKGVDNHAQRTVIGIGREEGAVAITSTNPSKPNVEKTYHENDEVRTIPASNAGNNNPFVAVKPVLTPDRINKRQNGRRVKDDGEEAFTLTGQDIHGVMIEEKEPEGRNVMLHNIYGGFGEGVRVSDDVSPTIRTPAGGGHLPVVANCLDQDGYLRTGERPRDAEGKPQLLPIGYRRIRRLTPTECERLQAFPDGWTANGIDENGEKTIISDTQRYKMCGNAVTTRVVTHIGMRLMYGLESVIPIVPESVEDWFG